MSRAKPDYELMLQRSPALKRALDRRWLEDGEMSDGEREDIDRLFDTKGEEMIGVFDAREAFDQRLSQPLAPALEERAARAANDLVADGARPLPRRRRQAGPRGNR